MRRRDQPLTGVNQALGAYLRDIGLTRQSREVLAAVLWTEAVGPWYAQHTTVVKVADGVITIHCDSAPHAQQLQADSGKILARLNVRVAEQLGGAQEPLKELRAGTGFMGRAERASFAPEKRPPPPVRRAELDAIILTASEEEWVLTLSGQVEDDAVRRRFATALRSHVRLRRWQLAHGWRECEGCGGLLAQEEETCLLCEPLEKPAQGSMQNFDNRW